MIDGCKVKIENNSNAGDIIVQVHCYRDLIEYQIYKELSELNQEQKERVLNFVRKIIKK